MTVIKKKIIIDFVESFNFRRRPPSKHGPICYDIYNKAGKQLNLRPILIIGGDKGEFGDTGLKHIADSFGVKQQFLKQLLSGEKTKEDYEREVLVSRET